AAIGSDIALMQLNGIAQKLKFKALQTRAREKIQHIADSRQLTVAELEDRLAPDLGLDEQGSLTLDFGPRRFSVSFDEALKPFVRDEKGSRLKDLPKPNKSDDATLSAEAVGRYKALKKDARTVAAQQI
ncbi:MolR family transcriptional regulator, partial [Klebsiella aerogenes]